MDTPEEISLNAKKINVLAPKTGGKEITPSQASLPLGIEKDVDLGGIGMGVLSDGTPYLKTQCSGFLQDNLLTARQGPRLNRGPSEAGSVSLSHDRSRLS